MIWIKVFSKRKLIWQTTNCQESLWLQFLVHLMNSFIGLDAEPANLVSLCKLCSHLWSIGTLFWAFHSSLWVRKLGTTTRKFKKLMTILLQKIITTHISKLSRAMILADNVISVARQVDDYSAWTIPSAPCWRMKRWPRTQKSLFRCMNIQLSAKGHYFFNYLHTIGFSVAEVGKEGKTL